MSDGGAARRLTLTALPGIPMVEPGADLAAIILAGVARAGEALRDRDVLVVAQKIVSKSENRYVDLRGITPSAEALRLAPLAEKDPRLVEVILRESKEVMRQRPGALIVEHKLGYVHANAGVDRSNVEDPDTVLLLPADPDASARRLRAELGALAGSDAGGGSRQAQRAGATVHRRAVQGGAGRGTGAGRQPGTSRPARGPRRSRALRPAQRSPPETVEPVGGPPPGMRRGLLTARRVRPVSRRRTRPRARRKQNKRRRRTRRTPKPKLADPAGRTTPPRFPTSAHTSPN